MGSKMSSFWTLRTEDLKKELSQLILQKQINQAHTDYYLKMVNIEKVQIAQKRKEIREGKIKSDRDILTRIKNVKAKKKKK